MKKVIKITVMVFALLGIVFVGVIKLFGTEGDATIKSITISETVNGNDVYDDYISEEEALELLKN